MLSKLSNDETIVSKPEDKGGAVVILLTGHYRSMIMQHLLDKNTYKKLHPFIDNKIRSNFLRFLSQYKMCFTEPERKFLKNKRYEISNFYELPKIHKSKFNIICSKHLPQLGHWNFWTKWLKTKTNRRRP